MIKRDFINYVNKPTIRFVQKYIFFLCFESCFKDKTMSIKGLKCLKIGYQMLNKHFMPYCSTYRYALFGDDL